MDKYAPYVQGNTILPILEIIGALDLRIQSLVVVDIKSRKFAGRKKDAFEELIRTAGIPGQYFCRCSFTTWDVLLPTKEQALKLAETCINTKSFRLQLEYMGPRRIRVTVCNIPANLPGEVVASYLSAFGRVEKVTQQRASAEQPIETMCSGYAQKASMPSQIHFFSRPSNDDGGGGQTATLLELQAGGPFSKSLPSEDSQLGAAAWGGGKNKKTPIPPKTTTRRPPRTSHLTPLKKPATSGHGSLGEGGRIRGKNRQRPWHQVPQLKPKLHHLLLQ